MKKFWKRFEVWVTGLKADPFQLAQLKLTGFFTGVFVVIIIVYLVLLSSEFSRAIELGAREIPNPQRQQRFIQRAQLVTSRTLFGLQQEDILMFFVAMGVSYFLAGLVLRPIKTTIESQKRFMANASHELKTPLAIIKTEMEVFLRNKKAWTKDPEALLQRKQDMVSNLEEIDRMDQILEELSLAAKVGPYDGEHFQFEKINLTGLVLGNINRLQSYARNKHVILVAERTGPIYVLADPVRLNQVPANILKNAIDYSLGGGSVQVIITKRSGKAVVSFVDHGIGIAQQDLAHIFERFFRGRTDVSQKVSGAGLGLFIAQWVIKKHGGEIQVESELGKGTTVKVFLPLAATS